MAGRLCIWRLVGGNGYGGIATPARRPGIVFLDYENVIFIPDESIVQDVL